MRIIKITIYFLVVNLAQAQDFSWYEFEVDSLVSVQFPFEEVYELDTIVKNIPIYQLTAQIGNTYLHAQRSIAEASTVDENLSTLPYNLESLQRLYDSVGKGMLENSIYSSKETRNVKKGEYHGMRVVLKDESGKVGMESEMYLLNNYLYQTLYLNDSSLSNENLEYFMSSLTINPEVEASQFTGKSLAARRGYMAGQLVGYGLIALLIIWLIRKARSKPKKIKRVDQT